MAIVPVPGACSNCGSSGTTTDVCVVCNVTVSEILNPVTVNQGTSPWVVSGTVCIDDCGGSITVDDGGGSLTVDGTVAAAQSGIWNVAVSNFPASVEISNDVGNPIPVNGTVTVNQGTSPWIVSGTVTATNPANYAEDSPHTSGDIGTFTLGVRNDANAVLTSTNLDYSPFSVTSTGALNIADAGGSITVDGTVTALQGTSPWVVSGTVAATQSGAWTVTANQGTSPWVVSGTVTAVGADTAADAHANPTTALIADAYNSVFNGTTWDRMRSGTALGSVLVNNPTAANLQATVTQGTSPWVVSGTVTANQGTSPWVVSGTVATNAERAEDSPHTSGQTGDFVLAVRNDTHGALTSTDLDYSPFSVDSSGALNIADNGGSITVDGTVTVLQGTSPWVVSGTVTATNPANYAEDSPHTSGDIGTFTLGVRNDANAVLTSTNLDYSPFSVTSTGALNIADAGGSITVDGTVSATQSGAWTVTANQGTSPWVVSGTVTSVGADTAADAHANPTTALIVDSYNSVFNGTTWDRTRSGTALGSVLVNNPTAANLQATVTQGTSPWVVSLTSTTITGTVAVTQSTSPWVVSGTVTSVGADTAADAHANPTTALIVDSYNSVFNGTTWDRMRSGTALGSVLVNNPTAANLQATVTQGTSPWIVQAGAERAEDSPHTSGQTGNFVLGVRNDTQAVLTSTDLDYSPIAVDSAGRVQVVGSLSIGGTARDDTDDQAVVATGAGLQVVRNYVFDGTNWDRARSASPTADPGNVGVTVGALVISDGTNLRRAFSPPAITDGNGGTGSLSVGQSLFNGATYDRARSGGVTGMQGVAGAEAHDAPVTGNPVLLAARASGVLPTAVSADGDVTRLWNTKNGALRVYPSRRRRQGIYFASLGNTAVTAAADAATGGRFWLQNPAGGLVTLAIRKIYFSMTTSGAGLLSTTSPVFTVERFTFTGTASGASIAPAKRDSGDAANQGVVRTASTGMTITAGAAAHGFQIPGALLATSANAPQQIFPAGQEEDEFLTIAPGEGIVIRQATAGTAADNRIANFDITWEEFNTTDYGIRD